MSGSGCLTRWLDAPGTSAVTFHDATGGRRRVSYDELARQVSRIADQLARCHRPPGSPAVVSTADPQAFLIGMFACMAAGVPCSPLPAETPFSPRTAHAGAVAGIVAAGGHTTALLAPGDAGSAEVLATRGCTPYAVGEGGRLKRTGPDPASAGAPPPPEGPPPALIQFTSGSTGTPRPVRLSVANVEANVASISDWVGIDEGSLTSTWLPLHHDMGLIGNLVVPVCAQAELDVRPPVAFLRSPLDWLGTLSGVAHGLTAMPTFGLRHVLRHLDRGRAPAGPWDLSGWRTLILGAERVDPDVMDRFAERLAPWGFTSEAYRPAYGLAEATLAVTGVRDSSRPRVVATAARPDDRIVSCGRPLPGTEVEVVDASGATVPDGVTGELRVRGPSVTVDAPDDGLLTGDAGFVVDGEVYVIGRFGDSVKVFGRAVFAEEVEAALVRAGVEPRHVVLLGYDESGPVALVVAETRSVSWQSPAETAARKAFPDLGLRAVNVAAGRIARTTSGKPRRQETWRRLVRDGAIVGTEDGV